MTLGFSLPKPTQESFIAGIRPAKQTIDHADEGLVWSASGVVEVLLLLPEPWFEELLDDAESKGVTVARPAAYVNCRSSGWPSRAIGSERPREAVMSDGATMTKTMLAQPLGNPRRRERRAS